VTPVKWFYGRYTFLDATRFENPYWAWVCADCGVTGEQKTADDTSWAAHDHEAEVHGQRLYPADRP